MDPMSERPKDASTNAKRPTDNRRRPHHCADCAKQTSVKRRRPPGRSEVEAPRRRGWGPLPRNESAKGYVVSGMHGMHVLLSNQ